MRREALDVVDRWYDHAHKGHTKPWCAVASEKVDSATF